MGRMIDFMPEIGEICNYYGNKQKIHGLQVKCINYLTHNPWSVSIQGFGTGTRWDGIIWNCKTEYLSPSLPQEPDWEV